MTEYGYAPVRRALLLARDGQPQPAPLLGDYITSKPPWATYSTSWATTRASGTHPPLHPLELSPTSSGWPASLERRGSQIGLQHAGGRGLGV